MEIPTSASSSSSSSSGTTAITTTTTSTTTTTTNIATASNTNTTNTNEDDNLVVDISKNQGGFKSVQEKERTLAEVENYVNKLKETNENDAFKSSKEEEETKRNAHSKKLLKINERKREQIEQMKKESLVLSATSMLRSQRHIFCLVRPPGHHVGRFGRTEGCCSHGFCLLNNVAIGVNHARITHGLKRIAVLDFDVHFGNGTYSIFKNDPFTFFSSTHLKYTDGETEFFASELKGVDDNPNNSTNNIQKITNGGIDNQNHCYPIQNVQHLHDTYENNILPALLKFDPELILLSAGFDGHVDDPLGGDLQMKIQDYRLLTKRIVNASKKCTNCKGIVSVLEGGYDIRSSTNALAKSVLAHVEELNGGKRQDYPIDSKVMTTKSKNQKGYQKEQKQNRFNTTTSSHKKGKPWKHICDRCGKSFQTGYALGGHKGGCRGETTQQNNDNSMIDLEVDQSNVQPTSSKRISQPTRKVQINNSINSIKIKIAPMKKKVAILTHLFEGVNEPQRTRAIHLFEKYNAVKYYYNINNMSLKLDGRSFPTSQKCANYLDLLNGGKKVTQIWNFETFKWMNVEDDNGTTNSTLHVLDEENKKRKRESESHPEGFSNSDLKEKEVQMEKEVQREQGNDDTRITVTGLPESSKASSLSLEPLQNVE